MNLRVSHPEIPKDKLLFQSKVPTVKLLNENTF